MKSSFSLAFVILIALVTTAVTAQAQLADRARFGLGYSSQSSVNYQGRVLNVSTGYRFSQSEFLDVGVDQLTRTYSGDVDVKDESIWATSAQRLSRVMYVEERLATASTGDIYAQASGSVVPHYVFDKNDFGLGLTYDTFKLSKAGTLSPSYLRTLSDFALAGVTGYAVRTNELSLAGQALLILNPSIKHSVRLSVAGGRTVEDAGVTANFKSGTLGYLLKWGTRFQSGCNLTWYESDIRRELSIGVTLGYR